MIEIISIIITSVAIIVSTFSIWNLLKKVEIYEEDIQFKDDYIRKISAFISESDAKLNHPIIRGAFESDDEIGDFFQKMKDMITALKAYEKNYKGEETDPIKQISEHLKID